MGRPKNFSREEVLEKAMPVFWKHGFADTSLQELERATGVNKSGLYTEFRDKEDLFVACLRHYLESQGKRGLLTKEPLGWKNIENFLKNGPLSKGEQQGCFSVNSMREFAILPMRRFADGWSKANFSIGVFLAKTVVLFYKVLLSFQGIWKERGGQKMRAATLARLP
jgi:AcrR family transcriptional regulator